MVRDRPVRNVEPAGERLQVPASSAATAARVDRSDHRLALQMGSWAVMASGDSLTDADVDLLLEGIDLDETSDGFVEYRGSLLLWVVDSPDIRLHGDDASLSEFLRPCSTSTADTKPTGLTVSRVNDPNRGSHLTALCDVKNHIEIWLETPTPLEDEEVEGVDVQVLAVGSTLSAIQQRDQDGRKGPTS